MARILVVDDDPVVNGFIGKTLSNQGHDIVTSTDGLDALGKIYAEGFDLAILDIVLPGLSGIRLLDTLKRYQPKAVVIMISGQADLDCVIEALRMGAYDFIKKPVRKEEIVKVVKDALEESRLMNNSGYIYKDRRHKDRSSVRNALIKGISDSIFAGLALLVAIAGHKFLFARASQFSTITEIEFARLILGLVICYAFIFVLRRSFKVDPIGTGREVRGQIWRNLTLAYVLFLALLFIGNNVKFMEYRIVIGAGYLIGIGFLLANRFIFIPDLLSVFQREGKKNIIIAGSRKPAGEISRQNRRQPASGRMGGYINGDFALRDGPGPNARVIASREDLDRVVITDDVEELYIARDTLSSGEIFGLLDRFKGRKLKIVVLGGRNEAMHAAEIEAS